MTKHARSIAVALGLMLAFALGGALLLTPPSRGPTSVDVYDVNALSPTPPEKVIAEASGRMAVGIAGARCLAVGLDGRIHVAGSESIRVWQTFGGESVDVPLAHPAVALAVRPEGGWVVAESAAFSVLDEAGAEVVRNELGEGALVTGVAVHEKRIYLADAGARIVRVFDETGAALEPIGAKDPDTGDDGLVIYRPSLAVAVGEDGLLRVTDPGRHRVKIYAPDGTLVSSWKRQAGLQPESFSGCCNPAAVAMRSEGQVVTSEKGLPRVKLHAPDGTFLGIVAGHELFGPLRGGEREAAVAVDPAGRVLVLSPSGKELLLFTVRDESNR